MKQAFVFALILNLACSFQALAADNGTTTTNELPAAGLMRLAPPSTLATPTQAAPSAQPSVPVAPVITLAPTTPPAPVVESPLPSLSPSPSKPSSAVHVPEGTATPHHRHPYPDASTTVPPPDASGSHVYHERHRHHGGMRTIDYHGNVIYICGMPIYDAQGAMVGSTGSMGCTTSVVASSYPPAILSNGYITYPPGTMYQNLAGQWQTCPYPLVFDTRTNLTTCDMPETPSDPDPASDPSTVPVVPKKSLPSDNHLPSDKNIF